MNAGADEQSALVGSPMKKQRASLTGPDADTAQRRLGATLSTNNIGEILGSGGGSIPSSSTPAPGTGWASGTVNAADTKTIQSSAPLLPTSSPLAQSSKADASPRRTDGMHDFGGAIVKREENDL